MKNLLFISITVFMFLAIAVGCNSKTAQSTDSVTTDSVLTDTTIVDSVVVDSVVTGDAVVDSVHE